jgi:hypothetical protein
MYLHLVPSIQGNTLGKLMYKGGATGLNMFVAGSALPVFLSLHGVSYQLGATASHVLHPSGV